MSQAEELLDSLTEDQIVMRGINPVDEPHIVVESDKTITVPDELKHIAVQGDHNIETVTFDCPRYWDGHDLSQMSMRIVYQRPDGHREPHLVENLRVDEADENTIHFDWTISGNATTVRGNISFMVCGKLSNAEGVREREWHTRLNQDLIVDEGMDCFNDEIVEQNPDIIEAILVQLDELKNTGGSVEGAVLYSKQNLTAEQQKQARDNIGAVSAVDVESAVNNAIGKADLKDFELLGQAPQYVSGADNTYNIVIDVKEETSVSITSDTVADLSTVANSIGFQGASETYENGIYTLTSTAGALWFQHRKYFDVGGLIPGEKYVLMYDVTGVTQQTNLGTNYYALMSIHDNEGPDKAAVLSQEVHINGDIKRFAFTAPSATVRVYLNVGTNATEHPGAQIQYRDIWINKNSANELRTEVYKKETTISERLVLTGICGAVTIETIPSADIYSQAVEEQSTASILYGKTCVCFGDSITGNYAKLFDYPSVIAEKTGMTVVNGGFGGCRMAKHPSTTYDAYSMYRLADSVVSGDWSVQDAVADAGTPPYAVDHISELKALDWNEVDIVTILFGANDFTGGVGIEDEANPYSTNHYIGAARYSIEKLLTAYPNLRIVLVSPLYHYKKDGDVITDTDVYTAGADGNTLLSAYIEALEKVADEYKLPFFNMYNTLGINKMNREMMLPDGAHPSEAGIKRIGESFAARLSAI